MTADQTAVAGAAATWHRPLGRDARTQANIDEATRGQLAAVRDSIDEAAGADLVTLTDVIRLSLLVLGGIDELAETGDASVDPAVAEVIAPFTEHVRSAVDPAALTDVEPAGGGAGED